MKNLLKRVMSIAAATALLMTSVISVEAVGGHAHHNGDTNLNNPNQYDGPDKYTITLTKPAGVTVDTDASYGAYQIFTGTIPENLDPTKGTVSDNNYLNPGSQGADNNKSTRAALPITDIKWGNAFGDVDSDTWQKNIVGFVIALADPYLGESGEYHSAFDEFDDFEGFIKTGTDGKKYLADDYVDGGAEVNADSSADLFDKVKYDKLATAVADIVAENTSREWLQAFTDILGGYGESYSSSDYDNKGFVTQYYGGEWESDAFKISVDKSGYYMILDRTDVEAVDESYSARMLFVVNNVTQVLKEDAPKLTKKISRNDGEDNYIYETEAAGIDDEVDFRLTGSLPSNYAQYTLGYQFIFEDTLSKGLTLKGTEKTSGGTKGSEAYNDSSLKITVVGAFVDNVWTPTAKFTLADTDFVTDPTHSHTHGADKAYTATYEETDGQQKLTVKFPCLREIQHKENIEGSDKTFTLGYDVTTAKGSVIYIDYTAVVNKDAIVSPANGNKNTATLTYSDNPQAYGDTDDTTEDKATVYTFGLDIIKVDAAQFLKKDGDETAEGVSLANAEFVIARPSDLVPNENTTWEYAMFKFISAEDAQKMTPVPTVKSFTDNGYYTIVSWEKIDGADKKGEKFDPAWIGTTTVAITGVNGNAIKSGDKGVLNISGLNDEITYTIAETKAPTTDYAKIDPFTITLEAAKSADEYTGKLSAATSDKDTTGSFSFDKPVDITDKFEGTPKTDADGSANMLVANFKYENLPSTGGIGVYIYYIAGGCIVALALVLFALSKKKKTNK